MLHFKKLGLILFPRGNSNQDDSEKSQELSQKNEYVQDFDHYKLVYTTTRPVKCCLMRNCHSFPLLRWCETNQDSGVHLWHMRWIPYWAILPRLYPAEEGKWLFPSIHHLWAQISTIVSSLGHFSSRMTLLNWKEPSRSHQDNKMSQDLDSRSLIYIYFPRVGPFYWVL